MKTKLHSPGTQHRVYWTAVISGDIYLVENPPDHPLSPFQAAHLAGVTEADVEVTSSPWCKIVAMPLPKSEEEERPEEDRGEDQDRYVYLLWEQKKGVCGNVVLLYSCSNFRTALVRVTALADGGKVIQRPLRGGEPMTVKVTSRLRHRVEVIGYTAGGTVYMATKHTVDHEPK